MGRRVLACAGFTFVLLGCTFDESAPEAANIQCEVNEQCPAGWRCATRLGRCVQRSDVDAIGPSLVGSVSPALVRPGMPVVISLTADEPLLGSPEVEVRAGTSVRLVSQTTDTSWTFTPPAGEPDGLLSFFGSAEDLAGNGTRGVALGATRVDGTAATVVSARVSPETVSASTPVSVVVGLSEDIRAGAGLVVRSTQGDELLRLTSADGDISTLRFEVTPPASFGDGTLVLELEGVVDQAGNVSPAAEVGRATVDATAPVVGPLGLAGRRFSAQPGFDVVVVPVDVTGATRVQACFASECRDAVPQRFLPSVGVPTFNVLGGSVSTVVAPGSPPLNYEVYTGRWTAVGSVTPPATSATVTLTAATASAACNSGIRVVPSSLATSDVQVDYVEFTIRYR